MADGKTREQRDKEWWDAWWAEDFSWDGLGAIDPSGDPKHPWGGWVVDIGDGSIYEADKSPNGRSVRPATLQDYWREQESDLITGPDGARFTRVHLPPAWKDGEPTEKVNWPDDALDAVLAPKLLAGGESIFTGEWPDQKLEGQDRRAQLQGSALLRAATHPQGRASPLSARFERAAFLRGARFDSATFSAKANFTSATFSGEANFTSATFSGDALFLRTTFAGEANFACATFSRLSLFLRATFSGKAGFDRATFSSDAGFTSATFSGDVGFDGVNFSGHAGFDSATFSGGAGFTSAIFSGEARFTSATFSGEAAFYGASFSRLAQFLSATFLGEAGFNRATFSGLAGFHGVTFSDGAVFTSATLSSVADFDSATFSGEANFNSATFSSVAIFLSATFFGDARFNSATLSDDARFNSVTFSGGASFNGATFSGDASFNGATFSGDASFYSVTFSDDVSFFSATFSGDAYFLDARFQSTTSFARTRFEGAPKFEEARIHQDTTFDGARFPRVNWSLHQTQWLFWALATVAVFLSGAASRLDGDWFWAALAGGVAFGLAALIWSIVGGGIVGSDEYQERITRAFRTLTQLSDANRNRRDASKFYRLELKATRLRRSTPPVERFLSWLYDVTSDYGESLVRPLMSLMVIVSAFAVLFWAWEGGRLNRPSSVGGSALISESVSTADADFIDAARFSLSRVFPFGPWAVVEEAGCGFAARLLALDTSVAGEPDCRPSGVRLPSASAVAGHRLLIGAAAALESLLSLTMAFLVGLAARRRFQIG